MVYEARALNNQRKILSGRSKFINRQQQSGSKQCCPSENERRGGKEAIGGSCCQGGGGLETREVAWHTWGVDHHKHASPLIESI